MQRFLQLLSIDNNPGAGPLARLDARVKLIVAIAAILASLFSTRAALPLATLGVSLGLLAAFGAPWRIVLLRLTAPLGLVLVVAALRAILTGATPLWSLRLGPWTLVVSREGAAEGVLLAVRVLGSVGVLVVISTFTQAHEIFAALRWMRFPRTWIEIATLMVRSIFTLFEQAASVLSAQRARLGHATFRRTLDSAGRLAGIVLLRSIEQAERTHEAMTARGYQGCQPEAGLPPLTRRDAALCAACVGLIAAALAAERLFL
jgi:cobalt/nickel transport system permease protein